MGLRGPKSLLRVKESYSFLDLIALQALNMGVPLVLMNSFSTREDSLAALKKYPDLWQGVPIDFTQHKVPKIVQEDVSPAVRPANPALEWSPPGHGDIYLALMTSGILDRLLDAGYAYAFVSNADNLGAVLDPAILGYVIQNELPFMMEVTERTEADRKGGHLARSVHGGYLLREIAQCPEQDKEVFQDIRRHRYFNTNNLWINLAALKRLLLSTKGVLGLPMIRNRKTVDPRDPESTPVYQLETAMGSAIGIFEGAAAIRVPRSRFAPVKNTNDLLAVRSDGFVLADGFQMLPNPARVPVPLVIDLDPEHYKLVDDFEARFPHGAPSLIDCESLRVKGDLLFGRAVIIKGHAALVNDTGDQAMVSDGEVIQGEWRA
jgi:UTP--glucose-1-phosphate uridylyltransferase